MKYVLIGRLVNTHGLKGEVRILSSFKYKDKVFKKGMKIYIGKDKVCEEITGYRYHKIFDMITMEGYNDINPVQFGYENCQPSHHFGPALRTYWLLHYVVRGKGVFKIEGREYTVKVGNIFVIPPFIETYYEADKDEPWEYIWVGFTTSGEFDFGFSNVMYMPHAHHIFESI